MLTANHTMEVLKKEKADTLEQPKVKFKSFLKIYFQLWSHKTEKGSQTAMVHLKVSNGLFFCW